MIGIYQLFVVQTQRLIALLEWLSNGFSNITPNNDSSLAFNTVKQIELWFSNYSRARIIDRNKNPNSVIFGNRHSLPTSAGPFVCLFLSFSPFLHLESWNFGYQPRTISPWRTAGIFYPMLGSAEIGSWTWSSLNCLHITKFSQYWDSRAHKVFNIA
jgi:hypothetical protein